jgi:transketolase
MADIKTLKDTAAQIRRDVLRMVHTPASGHTGGSLGCADFFTLMYFDVLNHNPENFSIEDKNKEDLFFLSNGHIAPVWYSALARSGYFPLEELKTLRQIDSRLQGHPTTEEDLPGIRVASGSLGQGLSIACGAALAKKLNNDDSFVYVLMGDGEIQEGQVWEAAAFAPAKKINNLIAFIDYNQKQIDGPTDEVLPLLDLRKKWEAFGWHVLETDGNDIKALKETIAEAKKHVEKEKPIMIIMATIMGKGVDFMEDKHGWHGKAPNDEELEKALAQIPETLGDY